MQLIDSTPEFVAGVYSRMARNLGQIRKRLDRPLTFAEKILFGHLDDPAGARLGPGKEYLALRPDRVAMQDATAQMALLQFMQSGRERVAAPTTVHCDHLIRAQSGADPDMAVANRENREIYDFLATSSARYGIGFWKPGSGIIHQVVLENYAFPGGMMIGTDSHTPNAGGLGMFAAGIGGADAVDVMAGFPWEVLQPKLIGVRLTGALSGWTSPKDVILKLCGLLTVRGGTNCVVEYFGPGVRSLSCTGKGTITNMGAELGATTSVFPFDERMETYLRGTGRAALADLIRRHPELQGADPEVEKSPDDFFDRIVEIDLSALEPHIVGPHTPDLARPVSEMARAVRENDYPDRISVTLIGSCTNSSYEDLSRAADVAEQAREQGMKLPVPLLVTPGSEQIRATIVRDGQMESLQAVGGNVLANACGPCIGQWKRDDLKPGKNNTILSSFNRNFPRRNDGNPTTLSFLASPEIVLAYGLAGRLSFNPLEDPVDAGNGKEFRLRPPQPAPELPEKGFVQGRSGYQPPPADPSGIEIRVEPDSERLQLLEPFAAWDGNDFRELPVLFKAKGKCTTDHISPAGPWLRFRGHLDRISDNMFNGAVNAFTGKTGTGTNQLSGEKDRSLAQIAREYLRQGIRWVAVGDENYGEGSSREHAAMSPRFLGAAAILTRSFARIHESNLKKQGVLPLTFVDPSDYDKVGESDRISIEGLGELSPGKEVRGTIHQAAGGSLQVRLRHSLNREQIDWFRAGSALNVLKNRSNGGSSS